MINPHVLVVVPTYLRVMPQCNDAILAQTYPNFSVMTHMMKPEVGKCKTYNSARNRQYMRHLALGAPAETEFFWLVDSDTVPQKKALAHLVEHNTDVVGGWSHFVGNPDKWISGDWSDDKHFVYDEEVAPGICKRNMVGLGCLLISREVMEKVPFDPGLDDDAIVPDGSTKKIGICAKYGRDCQAAGFGLYMDSRVVCDHLPRPHGYG